MEMTTESIIKLANYFGEDPTIACEGVKEFMGKAKEKIKNLCRRIREFIARVAAWIRGKFAAFLKHDTYRIDKELWKNANSVLMIESKLLNETQDILKRVRPCLNIKTDSDEDNAKVEAITKPLDTKVEKLGDLFTNLEDSAAYKFVEEYNMSTADKTKFTVISAKPLNTYKASLVQLLDATNKEIDNIEKLEDQKELNYSAWAQVSSVMSAVIGMAEYLIKTINTIVSSSVPKNSKEVKGEIEVKIEDA